MTTIPPYDEAVLMPQFRAGEDAAFAKVYQQFYQRVYYYVRRWLRNGPEVEDITVECFIKLWTRKETFPSLDAVGAFLYVAARNSCVDHFRRSQREADNRAGLLALLDIPEESPFQLEDLRLQLLDLISTEVNKLPEKMREIFLLSYSEGLKPAEIAARLGISVKTVKNQRLNAVNILRSALADHPMLFTLLFLFDNEHRFFS